MLWLSTAALALIDGPADGGGEWSALETFTFAFEGATPPAKTLLALGASACDAISAVSAADTVGRLSLKVGKNRNDGSCYRENTYADSGYAVESGTIVLMPSQSLAFEAYKVHTALTAASSLKVAGTMLYWRFSEEGTWQVYKSSAVAGTMLAPEPVGAKVVVTNTEEYLATSVDVSGAGVSVVYFVARASTRVSAWMLSNTGVEHAQLWNTSAFTLYAERFDVSASARGATPFDPATGWSHTPIDIAFNFGTWKRFFRVSKRSVVRAAGSAERVGVGGEGVVWQDASSGKVFATWLDGSRTFELPNPHDYYLEAAVSCGGDGNIVYVLAAAGGAADGVTAAAVDAVKVSSSGATLVLKHYDTGKDGMGLDFWAFFESGASLAWDERSNHLGLVLSRTKSSGADGQNHQGSVGVVLDGRTLAIVHNFGQFSRHSFASSVSSSIGGASLADSDGFIAVDLGDTDPRGISVHWFQATTDQSSSDVIHKSKVVYSFKARHATHALSSVSGTSYDEYTAISSGSDTYYKYSHDNNVYTEIAHSGAVQLDDGSLMVFFAGENSRLDNRAVGQSFNAPRNLAMVRVGKDSTGEPVVVSTSARTETGGYYNDVGEWVLQRNVGVVWITDYSQGSGLSQWEAVTRIKAARVDADQVIVLFEVWDHVKYLRTMICTINSVGEMLTPMTTSPWPLRLAPTDEVSVSEQGDVIIYSASAAEKKIIRYIVKRNARRGGTPFKSVGISPTASAASSRAAKYVSDEGIAFGVIVLIVAIVALSSLFIFVVIVIVFYVLTQRALADDEESIPARADERANGERANGLLIAVVTHAGAFHPRDLAGGARGSRCGVEVSHDGEKALAGKKAFGIWFGVATVLRLLLVVLGSIMWIAAAASLEPDGGATVKDSRYGALQEPARGWAVWLLLLALFSFAHDVPVLLLQIPLGVHSFMHSGTWPTLLERALSCVISSPFAVGVEVIVHALVSFAGAITALGAGGESKDTNGGFVLMVVVLHLSIVVRLVVLFFAVARLVTVLLLPASDAISARIADRSRASLSAKMASAGEGGADVDITVTATTVQSMATAKWDFIAGHPTELSFAKGDRIVVTDMSESEPGWWSGYKDSGKTNFIGLFPFNRVALDK